MNIALVDDSPMDLERLQKALTEYAVIQQLDLEISCFSNGEELLAGYQPFLYTIIFLDIYMDQMTGIEAAEKIRRIDHDIILAFLTTSEEHRADAFQVFASSYLLKPVRNEEVFRFMDHILHLHTETEEKRFFFVSNRQEHSVRYQDIVSFQTDGNYILVNDLTGNTFRTRMLLSEVEKLLSDDNRFLSILRGVIVNMDHVIRITDEVCVLKGDRTFPINTKKSKVIRNIWHNYNFQKLRKEARVRGGSR